MLGLRDRKEVQLCANQKSQFIKNLFECSEILRVKTNGNEDHVKSLVACCVGLNSNSSNLSGWNLESATTQEL